MPSDATGGASGILLGLASAASWGAGDFSGGLAARRGSAFGVVLVSQAIGLLLLIGLALLLAEAVPSPADLLWGGAAGLTGGLGLVALYQGLATGRMGVVAPVAAVVSAIVPVLYGLWAEGLPAVPQMLGFALALLAVWLVSRTGDGGRTQLVDLILPTLAGLGFGVFLILIGRVSTGGVLWPLAAARMASIPTLLLIATLTRQRVAQGTRNLPLVTLVGMLDSSGNAFYALAAQAGRLDVAAVLSSLYPAGTVLLARLLLKEPVSHPQWLGVAAALVAVVLIAS